MIEKEAWKNLDNEISTCRKCQRLGGLAGAGGPGEEDGLSGMTNTGEREFLGLATRMQEYWCLGSPPVLTVQTAPVGCSLEIHPGISLYPALFRAGFSNSEFSLNREDQLILTDLFITAVCRCAPPGNKPTPVEIESCRGYLERELVLLAPAGGNRCTGSDRFP